MTLHFERSEYDARIAAATRALTARGLDGLLAFQQETMYWLTGYDTFGFCFFQCLYLGADGRLALITRSPDLRQAQRTSIIEDIRIWTDAEGAEPALQLRDMLESLGAQGKRLGIESNAYGLNHFLGKQVDSALDGFCRLEDASRLIDALRAVKSPAELEYVRRAGALADAALGAGLAETRPGADEGTILAAMQGAIFRGGGDYPANEFIIGSGEDAILCRYKSGRRVLAADDQLTLEFAGVYRHYHAALMRTVVIGRPRPEHERMSAACIEALGACETVLRPGHTAGDVFAAHARVMDAHGMAPHRLNACGYSLGAKFTPSWMDTPMFYRDNSFALARDMVFFAHMVLMDSDSGSAMTLGRTYILTDGAPLPLSSAPLEMIRR
jgi:Xaa-Pro dipeptidase